MELVGRTTIHPLVFYTGKASGYLTWALLALDYFGYRVLPGLDSPALHYLSLAATAFAAIMIAWSGASLERSVRLGLPTGETELKTGGIHRFSRNPMYVGFDALTIAGILATGSSVVLLLGLYSIVVYHFIILGEERFLDSAFGEGYQTYRARVRRYL